jgi:hypothetical protein
MRKLKHLGVLFILLAAGAAAGITGALVLPFLALHTYLLARLAAAFLVYAAADELFFREWNTAQELLKGNVAVGIFNGLLLAVLITAFVFGV